jgi:hypothetical protein
VHPCNFISVLMATPTAFSLNDGVQNDKTFKTHNLLSFKGVTSRAIFLMDTFFFFFKKYLNILLIKNYKHKTLTLQAIKFCKIIATCYEIT